MMFRQNSTKFVILFYHLSSQIHADRTKSTQTVQNPSKQLYSHKNWQIAQKTRLKRSKINSSFF